MLSRTINFIIFVRTGDDIMTEDKIGGKIKTILKRRGITQKVLAERLGIPKSSLSYYLNDRRKMPFTLVTHIAKELHLDLNAMFHIKTNEVINDEAEADIIAAFRKVQDQDKTDIANHIVSLLSYVNK